MIKKLLLLMVMVFIFAPCSPAHAQLESFNVRTFTANEFYIFIKVFSEMRGPLRKEILKDRKTNFEEADPLKYIMKVKGDKDVTKMLKKHDLAWNAFTELAGNVILAYFSIQPQRTKASLIRQMADYGLTMSDDQIPPEYKELVSQVIKTDEGAAMAAMALEFVLQIPDQNVTIVKKDQLTLDKMFYTRFWSKKL